MQTVSHDFGQSRSALVRLLPEIPVFVALGAGALILLHIGPDGSSAKWGGVLWTLFLVGCVLACAIRAMTHADSLAEHFGEPYGTIILTVSAITIEVAAVCAIMLGPSGNATVARDTMFAVLMIILNLLVGIIILVGVRKRAEAVFNLQSAGSYLAMIIALATITMVLPRFTNSKVGGWMSNPMEIFVGLSSLLIYGVFLKMQTSKHREFFEYRGERVATHAGIAGEVGHPSVPTTGGPTRSIVLLVISLVAVVLVAEGLAPHINLLLEAALIPEPIGGVFIAALVLAPEGFSAIRAARNDDMQRSINVLLGSALATIGLTVPAVLAIRWLTGKSPELGLEPPYIVLFVATLFLASFNLTRGRVNAIQGFVHLLLFLTWIIVILDESGH